MRWAILISSLIVCGCAEKSNDAETWTVIAKLDEASDFPTLEEIRPYRDALIAHRYRIIEVEKGSAAAFSDRDDVAVYHWVIRDGKDTEAKILKVGDRVTLEIQRMIDRPDLKGRYRKNALDAFDLQEFFAVETKPRRIAN